MDQKKSTKKVQQVDSAIAHVRSSFNNTLVTITTLSGDVLFSGSAGKCKNAAKKQEFKGSRKGTPFAATRVASLLAKDMGARGIKRLEVNMSGPGSGRDSVVRTFQSEGFEITVLRDVTPLPHNGCRAPKKRRV